MSNIPSEAKFIKPVNFNGVVKERRTTRISPLNGSVFGTNQIDRINFAIPSQSSYAIDMNTFHLHFKAEVFSGASANDLNYVVYFNNSIESIIDELIIKKGSSGQYLEDIKQYSYLDSIFMNFASSDFNRTPGKALLGIGLAQERVKLQNDFGTALDATIGAWGGSLPGLNPASDPCNIAVVKSRKPRRYAVPFRLSGLSNYGGILPTQIIDQVNSFTIEIILANAANCLQCFDISATNVGESITTAGYKLSEVYLTYDVVRMSEDYYDNLYASLNSSIPIEIPYKTWRVSTFSLPIGSQNVAFNINETFKSLNSIYVAFFKADEQNDFRIAGRDRLHFPNLKSYQLQINNQYYPLQPVVCENGASEAFLELLKTFGDGFLNSEYTGPFDFQGDEYTAPINNFRHDTLAASLNANNTNTTGDSYGKQENLTTSATNNTATDVGKCFLGATITDAVRCNNTATTTDPLAYPVIGTNARIATPADIIARRFMYNAASTSPTNFVLGFNLRKMMDVEDGESVGENLSEGSGIMTLRLELTGQSTTNYNVLVCCNHDAVFRIESNQNTVKLE